MRDIGRQLASHRTGRTTQEVEEWTDPEEAAKEVEELRRVRRQIRAPAHVSESLEGFQGLRSEVISLAECCRACQKRAPCEWMT